MLTPLDHPSAKTRSLRIVPEDAPVYRRVLGVSGAECGHCTNRIRKALLQVDGVVDAAIDPGTALMTVQLREWGPLIDRALIRAVQGASTGTQYRYLAIPLRSRFTTG